MPKIRTLKAGYFTSEDISVGGGDPWPLAAVIKVLGAGLMCCMADDDGRLKASVTDIKAEVFRHDSVTEAQIGEALRVLDRTGVIQLYLINKRPFVQIANWERHQYIPPKRKQNSTLPPAAPRRQHSKRTARAVPVQVVDSVQRKPRALGGMERIGDGIRDGISAGEPAVHGEDPDYIEIGRAWEVLTGHTLSATDREEVRTQLVQLDRLPVTEIISHLGDFMEWWSTQGIDRRPYFKNAISWLKDKNGKAADSGRRLVVRGVA